MVSYTTVTELPGQKASEEQIRRLYHRYKFASTFCKGKDVLEVACGAGIGLGYLARVATKVVGGDIDQNNLRFAISHYEGRKNIEVRELDAHQLPYEDKSFDVVILYEAIYYLTEPETFFREAQRVLRKEGVLLIATVNKDWSEFNPSPFSTRYFSVPELSELLRRRGFKPQMYGAFSVLPKSVKEKIVASVRKIAVVLHLIPKTMQGKEFLKKVFYGKLKALKGEIEEGTCEYSPPSPLPLNVPNKEYKVIYAVAGI